MNAADPLVQPVGMPANGRSGMYESDILYESINGQRLELPPMSAFECWLAGRLFGALLVFCDANKAGRPVVETLFLLNPETDLQRRPDVAFVSYDRWPKNQRVPRTNAWAVVPNVAAEVVSPSNTFTEVTAKVPEYFQAGCQRVWVILPAEEQVYAYRSATEIQILSKADVLDGENTLPGFRLPLIQLFEEEE